MDVDQLRPCQRAKRHGGVDHADVGHGQGADQDVAAQVEFEWKT